MPAVSVLAALRARQEAMAQGDKLAAEEAALAPVKCSFDDEVSSFWLI